MKKLSSIGKSIGPLFQDYVDKVNELVNDAARIKQEMDRDENKPIPVVIGNCPPE